MRGRMITTISLSDANGITELLAAHDGLPEGLSPAENQVGWEEALGRLATLVESSH